MGLTESSLCSPTFAILKACMVLLEASSPASASFQFVSAGTSEILRKQSTWVACRHYRGPPITADGPSLESLIEGAPCLPLKELPGTIADAVGRLVSREGGEAW